LGNPTYKQDEAGFLMANFQHMLVNGNEPFVFPSQVQQVFYFNDSSKPWWKVILYKVPQCKCVFPDSYGENISTNENASVLDAQGQCQMHQPFQVILM
jgi:hypothetical protein